MGDGEGRPCHYSDSIHFGALKQWGWPLQTLQLKRLILRVKGSELGTSRRRRLNPDLLAFRMTRGRLVEGAGHFYCWEHEGVLGSACHQGGGSSFPQARLGTCVDPFFFEVWFLLSGVGKEPSYHIWVSCSGNQNFFCNVEDALEAENSKLKKDLIIAMGEANAFQQTDGGERWTAPSG